MRRKKNTVFRFIYILRHLEKSLILIPVRPSSLTDREKERHLSDSCLSAIRKTAASKHTNYIMTVRTLARKLGHYSFHYYKTTSPLLPAAAPACWCAILIASSYTG